MRNAHGSHPSGGVRCEACAEQNPRSTAHGVPADVFARHLVTSTQEIGRRGSCTASIIVAYLALLDYVRARPFETLKRAPDTPRTLQMAGEERVEVQREKERGKWTKSVNVGFRRIPEDPKMLRATFGEKRVARRSNVVGSDPLLRP